MVRINKSIFDRNFKEGVTNNGRAKKKNGDGKNGDGGSGEADG